MTKDEILGTEPGYNLDFLIAHDIFNKTYLGEKYSTSIEAAWEVVEKLESNFNFLIKKLNNEWEIALISTSNQWPDIFHGSGKTAPEAICKAVLLAVTEANND